MKRRLKKALSAIGWVFLGMVVGWLLPMPRAYALKDLVMTTPPYRVVETTLLFQRLCAELLPTTPLGQHYLDLGYTHMNELVRLLWYDKVMMQQTWHVIELYTPAVEALLDGKGSTVQISQEMVDALTYFLSEMESRASPEIRQIVQEERARVPWRELAGLTVEEAWAELQKIETDDEGDLTVSLPSVQ